MQNELRAIIVDDEADARNTLQKLLERFCPQATVCQACKNLPDAVQAIKKHKPQLVFLDVEMPGHAGYEITQFIPEPDFDIVFVTAYDKYAVKAFELAAIDYLLKPIDVDRLMEAVNRAQQRNIGNLSANEINQLQNNIDAQHNEFITVADKGFRTPIALTEVVAFHAQAAYTQIQTVSKKEYLLSKNLSQVGELLDGNTTFFRSHKSWIINLQHVASYAISKGIILMNDQTEAKLSRYRKDAFLKIISA